MAIFLSGGGSGKQSWAIDKAFIESLKRKKPVLYIPLAREPPYALCLEWIQQNFKPFRFTQFLMIQEADELKKINLKDVAGVYIGGGNTFRLLIELRKCGFDTKLAEYIKDGRSYYGGSAGAIITGKDVKLAQSENETGVVDNAGMNLLSGHAVFCHYTKDNLKEIRDYLNETGNPVIAIPENGGVIIKKNTLLSSGSGVVEIFAKGKEARKLEAGQKITLQKA